MPFEGLNFGLARPSVQIENPLDVAAKGMQLQALRQQNQMGGMQAQQLQQQIKDAADLRATLQSSSSLDDALAKAQKLGSPAAQGFIKNALEMKEKGVKLNVEQFDLANKHLARVGQDVIGAANTPGITPQALAAKIQMHAQRGNIPPDQANEMLQSIPQNPADIPLWGRLQAVKLGAAPDTLKMFMPKTETKDTGSALVSISTNPLTGEQTQGGVVAKKTVTPGELLSAQTTRRGQDMGVGIYGGLPGAAGGAGVPRPGGQPGGGAAAPGSLDERLAGVPEGIRDLVKQVGTYQMLPAEVGTRQRTAVMGFVARAFPNYSVGAAEANNKFLKDLASSSPTSAGGQVQAMNNAFEHLGSLSDLVPQMGGSSIPLLNKMGNAASKATGGTAPVKWDTGAHLLAAEVQKMIKGGMATEGETKQMLDNLDAAGSPDQKKAVLGEIAEFMYGKIKSFEQRRASMLGDQDPGTSYLTPSAQQNLGRVFRAAGRPVPPDLLPARGGAPLTAQPSATSPQKPKLGAVVDGYVFLGGDPSKPTSWKKQ